MMNRLFLRVAGIAVLVCLAALCSRTFGQGEAQPRYCGAASALPEDSPEMEQLNRQVWEFIEQSNSTSSQKSEYKDAVTVPVIFFVVEPANGSPSQVSDTRILDQLAALNAAYAPWNINFCLARNDPFGSPLVPLATPGPNVTSITQEAPSFPGMFWVRSNLYASGGIPTPGTAPFSTFLNEVTSLSDEHYLMIFVTSLGGGTFGLSPVGTSSTYDDAVLIDFSAFGGYNCSTCNCYADDGLTLVHEIGHYFGLQHTFNRSNVCVPIGASCTLGVTGPCWGPNHLACEGCNLQTCYYKGDNICDIPPQAETDPMGSASCVTYNGAPAVCSLSSMPAVERNYMDYMADNFKTNFTAGQVDRMYAWMHLFCSGMVDVRHLEAVGCGNTVIYVNKNVSGGMQNGTSWADSYTYLQDALAMAQPGDEIWVAAASYSTVDLINDPTETFLIPDGVKVFGGFRGTEVSRVEQDPIGYPTTLDGDAIAYHVVTSTGGRTTALDGFTVKGGRANGDATLDVFGAGVLLDDSDMEIFNCTFVDNIAQDAGGAIYGLKTNSRITQCTFQENEGTVGAIMFHFTGSAQVLNCKFLQNNSTSGAAGAIELKDGAYADIVNSVFCTNYGEGGAGALNVAAASVKVVNCTFFHNSGKAAITSKGSSSLILRNTIIWDHVQNYLSLSGTSLVQVSYTNTQYAAFAGTGNISANPSFSGSCPNLTLQGGSPCINTGHNAYIMPLATKDILGRPRVFNASGCISYVNSSQSPPTAFVDMGAFEYRGTCSREANPEDETASENQTLKIWPNPTDGKVSIQLPTDDNYSGYLMDAQGRTLRALEFSGQHEIVLDMGDLPMGMYMIALESASGGVQAKIVRQ
jgi:hypothetical protein